MFIWLQRRQFNANLRNWLKIVEKTKMIRFWYCLYFLNSYHNWSDCSSYQKPDEIRRIWSVWQVTWTKTPLRGKVQGNPLWGSRRVPGSPSGAGQHVPRMLFDPDFLDFLNQFMLCHEIGSCYHCVWHVFLCKSRLRDLDVLESCNGHTDQYGGKYHYGKSFPWQNWCLEPAKSRCLETTTLERCAMYVMNHEIIHDAFWGPFYIQVSQIWRN